ncbi:MAG TPA: response regulator transcription factor [Actinomycetota bacterium]
MSVRVLVVDDTEHVRQMMAAMLQIQGFEVVGEAADAKGALELAAETTPNVIVLDFRMPDVDGITATRWLLEQDADLAIVMYSAYLTEEDEQRALDAGVRACVSKVEGVEALAREVAAAALAVRGERA